MHSKKVKNAIHIVSIILILAVALTTHILFVERWYSQGLILPNVYINNQLVGGLTTSDAEGVVHADIEQWLSATSVTVHYNNTQVTLDALGAADYRLQDLIDETLATHQNDGWFQRYISFIRSRFTKTHIDYALILDPDRLAYKLAEHTDAFHRNPSDAIMQDFALIDDEMKITVIPEVYGYDLDVEATSQDVYEAMLNNVTSVQATVITLDPDVTLDHYQTMSQQPLRFVQAFADCVPGTPLADAFIQMDKLSKPILVAAGETYSIKDAIEYAAILPQHLPYLMVHAPTAVYHTGIRAGMEIMESHPSLKLPTSPYLAGTDVMMDADRDLVMKNVTGHPMIIHLAFDTTTAPYRLVCKVYSPVASPYTYIRSMKMPSGDPVTVHTYHVYGNDTGGVIGRVPMDTYQYQPIPEPVDEDIDGEEETDENAVG